jgi:hypothetical protein
MDLEMNEGIKSFVKGCMGGMGFFTAIMPLWNQIGLSYYLTTWLPNSVGYNALSGGGMDFILMGVGLCPFIIMFGICSSALHAITGAINQDANRVRGIDDEKASRYYYR